jgi:cytochrome c oxidase cbb3-type subunit 4
MAEFYELLRSLWVVWLMAFFLAIAVWAYWPSNRRRLDAHAMIPFNDGQAPPGPDRRAER